MRGRDRCRCGSALALHGCGFRSGLLRLDRGVEKTIAAFDQFFQPLSVSSAPRRAHQYR